ncbi:hypothetical protein I302_102836 [Kwoniella bestiolae CBS 10118]|uniref:VPS9 domain-containing protein n=1 Tax=Kwoniella bestiolae CBS 10118 TaxID=1296100 RepID=A0A1B9GG33_9TREE|nr:hypothetical protein I302_01531 [Kwoniella bestiolae CBS 10118]OCF30013.1 hypothetical protein I302_01531 [Kwoniella bestiolae CBS 10118]
MADQPKPGLFSSLSLGRASRSPRPSNTPNETLTHPLLGASASSLNLSSSELAPPDATAPHLTHKSSGSWSAKSGPGELTNLPYKPRQRHGGGIGSAGSANSIFGAPGAASPTLQPTSSSVSTSPVTPTTIVSAPPTTSTSTSTTFALPPSTSDPPAQVDYSALSSAPNLPGSSSLTSRLQMQSLKAAAQRIGLGNGSMGMSMIDAIFDKGQLGRAKAGEGGDWGDLLRILMGGKAVLLLPTTPSSSLPMTPQTLRDHVAFIAPPVPLASSSFTSKQPGNASSEPDEREDPAIDSICVLVTLSGMIGTIKNDSITFESTVPSDSPLIRDLRDATTRQSVLSTLRPTHTTSSSLTSSSFPTFNLSNETAILPFPPPSKTGPTPTNETKEKEKPPPGKLGRINPFASLFGGSSNAPSPALSSSPVSMQPPAPPSPSLKADNTLTPERPLSPSRVHGGSRPSSPSPASPKPSSLLTFDHADNASIMSDTASISLAHGEGYQVTAYTVSRPLRYHDTHKTLTKAIRSHIREVLAKLPDKVIEKVIKLVLANACPPSQGDDLLKNQKGHSHDGDNIAVLDFYDPTTTGERLQDFMEGIYDDLISHYRSEGPDGLKRKSSGNVPWGRAAHGATTGGEGESVKEKRAKDRLEKEEYVEREASEGTEKVEAVVCRLLYNRLFSPLESDDARHDEALASRIAALNMLDLSLDHLGLITRPEGEEPAGTIAKGLADIVDDIGHEFQKLSGSDCLTPKDKASVLIKAHQVVVDGLARMPKVELRPEGEPYRPNQSDEPSAENNEDSPAVELSTISTPENRSAIASPASQPESLKGEDKRSNISPSLSESSDPLNAIGGEIEATPRPSMQKSPSVPQLVLNNPTTESQAESDQLQQAMSDSVITLTPSVSRDTSSSNDQSVPPPKAATTTHDKPGTSGADLILPIIIYSVVKSNPPQLASQLMYLRRYRSAICLTGEASYAIVNLTAVVEFLEHVDLAELGLGGESDRVMSIADLSPIGLNYLDESNADAASIASASSRLRGRVFQVGELAGTAAGSANKVITGVVDSSWMALRGLMGNGSTPNPNTGEMEPSSVESENRPEMRPRGASTFSLASVTASVASIAAAAAARNRSRASSRASEQVWGGNQELQEVSSNSRPASIRERSNEYYSSEEDGSESDADHEPEEKDTAAGGEPKNGKGLKEEVKERVSLSNRLASIGVLGRLSSPSVPTPPTVENDTKSIEETIPAPAPSKASNFLSNLTPRSISASLPSTHTPGSKDAEAKQSQTQGHGHGRRGSILSNFDSIRSHSPRGSISSIPLSKHNSGVELGENDAPLEKFMNCEVGDIKISEIGALLRDYRRLGNIVANIQKNGHQQ